MVSVLQPGSAAWYVGEAVVTGKALALRTGSVGLECEAGFGTATGWAKPSPPFLEGPSSDRWFNLPVDRLSYAAASAVRFG
ncbi:hypothetical protein ACOMHN_031613 [Nucella lapillus]